LKQPAIYILANKRNGTLCTGVTSNLLQRIWQHKQDFEKGFSEKYQTHLLVYFELRQSMYDAIAREKQIKAGSRAKKLQLIESTNPDWLDLYEELIRA
jgi:putative endonuclease